MAFHDFGDGIFVDAKISCDPAIGAPVGNGLNDLRCKLVGFRTLTELSTELLAARPSGRETGFDTLAKQITFELVAQETITSKGIWEMTP